ncbi:MAG: helix-turn-helix transcriptional regulator [Chloroflexi bacterium]|nr:helix-turn-helix transcriptional regulator [Chloroflexota bacterium]
MRGRGREWRWRGCSRRAVRFLEPTLLLLLHHSPAHGYTLLERLTEFGLEGLNPSVVYRALRDMEGRGWISSTWDEEQTQGPPRRVYCLTGLGDEALGLWTQDLQETRGLIDRLVGAYSRHMEEGEGEHH